METKRLKTLIDEFKFVAESGIDERKRVSLAKVVSSVKELQGISSEDLHFLIYVNEAGQILLDPSVSVPVREVWLYRNPAALAKVQEGLAELAKGEYHDLGSFAKYADDNIGE